VRVCLRRIVSKVVCVAYQDQARSLLWLLQIGVGQPLGAEVGFQTARRWCERHAGDPIAVFLIVDFSNAFNAADHRAFLEQVRRKMPGLVPWVEWRYSRPSVLRLGDREVASDEGTIWGRFSSPSPSVLCFASWLLLGDREACNLFSPTSTIVSWLGPCRL
jgi:hypothetical protein